MPSHKNSRFALSCRPRLETLEDRCVPTTYAITDLGAHITPLALNNNGAVVGDMVDSSGQSVGFLYQDGTLRVLNGRTGNLNFAGGINDSNQVVGGDSQGPVLWDNGTVTALPISGAIADNGTIAGGFEPAEVDVNGTVTALPVPGGGTFSLADAISTNGQFVAGFGPDLFNGSGESAPYLWNLAAGEPGTDLGGDPLGQALGVNNSGQVVGFANGDYGGEAFLYSNGQFIDLGPLAGGVGSSANAINNAGDVVGRTAGSHAFIYSNGTLTDLNSLVPPDSGFTLSSAVAINDSGQILASTTNGHGVLLTPVASPSMTVSGFPSTTTAGVAHNVTVTVLNPDGSIDTGYTGTVHFTSSDPQAALPTDYTFKPSDAGVHTFSVALKTAGSQSFTVTDTTTSTLFASQQGITVNPAAATHFALLVTSNSVNSGQSFFILVEALDAYGNIDTNYTGTVHFTSSDRSATLPANYTFKAGVGDAYFLVKLRTRGMQTITITDTLHHSISGSLTMDVI